jgi:Zn-dependent protease with chaperone function
MDFFQHQDKARKNTKLLVFYFIIAVVFIVASVYLACLLIFSGISTKRGGPLVLWHPEIFMYAAGGTLAIIVIGTLYKLVAIGGGGKYVAESLGGRAIPVTTKDPDERKLLNIVEEMSLASGVPVPPVYVMDNEHGINAFAAGYTPSDAVVGVTGGCMKTLKRDELQGVIAHEFSHILNGDMRLNLRLIGIIFGIVCLTVIGRILLRTGSRSRYYCMYSRNRSGGNPLPLLGLALIVIGWVGVFFGRLIQSAVSRQREFLADASAVQFTRNPHGLSGALQKIGGMAYGSKLESAHAEEASHMFFGNALGQSLFNGMATHPPLQDRIRAIDPSWEGKFPEVDFPAQDDAIEKLVNYAQERSTPRPPPVPPVIAAGFAPQTVRVQSVLPNLGKPTPVHLRYAEELRNSFPESVQTAAHDPLSASALIYALLLSRDAATRQKQLQQITNKAGADVQQKIATLHTDVSTIAERARLPLVELTIPALRLLSPEEFKRFNSALQWLVESDRQVDLFEFVLQKIILRHLEPQFGEVRRNVVQYYTMRPLVQDCAVLLSALANVASSDSGEIQKAFLKGVPYLRTQDAEATFVPREHCSLDQVDNALNKLAGAVPQIKKNVIEACVHVVGADGVIREHEAELLRGICDSLDCPMPPFVSIE